MKDYYQILGVSEGISQEDLKKTYRKLSKQHHPDRGGNENKFKEIAEAYDTLGDKSKRQDYDNRRANPFAGGNFFGGGDAFGGGDPFDMLNRMFNRQTRQQRPKRGKDLHLKIGITLRELYLGIRKKIKYEREVSCKPCSGSGGDFIGCTTCNGSGKLRKMVRNGNFQQILESGCYSCKGSGKIPVNICPHCVGSGKATETETFDFLVNKDMRPHEKMSYPGFGNKIKNGVPGNLIVSIEIKKSNDFDYEGDDLITSATVNPLDVFMGKKIDIDVFGDLYNFTLPPYFDLHQKYLLRGKGLVSKFGKGNLVVNLKMETPQDKLTEQDMVKINELRDRLTSE